MALTKSFVAGCMVVFGACVAIQHGQAQFVNPVPPRPPPVFNPSSPSTVPQTRQTPVSPNSRSANSRSGASTRAPVGQDLRLTIVSTDENDPASKPRGDASKDGGDADKAGDENPLDSIGEMYAALRTCWMPPPKNSARRGMEYTVRFAFNRGGEIMAPPRVTYSSRDASAEVRSVYRDAVNAALARCMPLHFSDDMAGAVAGRPIAIRFVDERTIHNGKSLQ